MLGLIDQFSLLHLASGIVAYFWFINLGNWFLIHLLYEIIENTDMYIAFVNMYVPIWPGGKKKPDSISNSLSDQFFSMLGWILAYVCDYYSTKYNLYQ